MDPLTPSELTAFGAIFLIAMFLLKLLSWMIKNRNGTHPKCSVEIIRRLDEIKAGIDEIKRCDDAKPKV